MLVYFELVQPVKGRWSKFALSPGIYYGEHNTKAPPMISYQANRIWEETDDGVVYLKDRLSWNRKVDVKEFAWIKLRAKPLRNLA